MASCTSPVRLLNGSIHVAVRTAHMGTLSRSQIVQQVAAKTGQKLTLKQMMEYGETMTPGKLIKSARHLQRELPVRIAQRIVDFEAQPYIVVANPHFKEVYDKYNDAFDR